ncbi:transposase [Niabella terrae]
MTAKSDFEVVNHYYLWQKHKTILSKNFWEEHAFWSDGYFVCSIGEASPETVRQYILSQG